MTPTELTIAVTVGFLIFFLGILLSIGLYLRKSYQPLKARRPILSISIILSLASLTFFVSITYSLPGNASCIINLFWFEDFAGFTALTFIRSSFLLYAYSLSVSCVGYSKGVSKKQWLIRHKHWFTNGNIMKVVGLLGLFIFFIPFMFGGSKFASSLYSRLDSTECEVFVIRPIMVLISGCNYVYITLAWLYYFLMRKARDNFYIRNEFRDIAISSTISLFYGSGIGIGFNVSGKVVPEFLNVMLNTHLVVLMNYFVFGFNILRLTYSPIYTETPASSISTVENQKIIRGVEDLENFLEYKSGFNFLKEFLASEFCAENALFLKAVKDLQKAEPRDKLSQAKVIFNDFVDENAPYCVNISYLIRKKAQDLFYDEAKLQEVDFDQVFKEAEMEVKELILKDSFRRFQRLPNYPKIKDEMRKLKSDVAVLEELSMV